MHKFMLLLAGNSAGGSALVEELAQMAEKGVVRIRFQIIPSDAEVPEEAILSGSFSSLGEDIVMLREYNSTCDQVAVFMEEDITSMSSVELSDALVNKRVIGAILAPEQHANPEEHELYISAQARSYAVATFTVAATIQPDGEVGIYEEN